MPDELLPVDAADLGSRYVVKGYAVSALTPLTNLVTQTVERLRVEELKAPPMTGPVTTQYFLKKKFTSSDVIGTGGLCVEAGRASV